MAFLSDSQLLSDLADTLQKDPGTLQPYWNRILVAEHAKAYNWLLAALLRKGFLLAQITSWDMGAFYERDLTLWQTLRRGAALQSVDDKLLGTLDVRQEVMDLDVLTSGGVAQDPAGTYGQPSTGAPDTSTDIFVWPDPSGQVGSDGVGQQLGDPTQW